MFGTGILTFGRHTVVIPLMRPEEWNARSEEIGHPPVKSWFESRISI
jgi:hypothetical protein